MNIARPIFLTGCVLVTLFLVAGCENCGDPGTTEAEDAAASTTQDAAVAPVQDASSVEDVASPPDASQPRDGNVHGDIPLTTDHAASPDVAGSPDVAASADVAASPDGGVQPDSSHGVDGQLDDATVESDASLPADAAEPDSSILDGSSSDSWVSPCSLDQVCVSLHRACVDDSGAAVCGDCLDGYHLSGDGVTCTNDPCDPNPSYCAEIGSTCNADGVTLETCTADLDGCRTLSTQTCAGGCTAGACNYLPDCLHEHCFLVPPTKQTSCYNDSGLMSCTAFPCNADGTPTFCGQDAQYPDNSRSYTCYSSTGTVQDPCGYPPNANEVVTDSLSGLMWQRAPGTTVTWQQAIDACNALTSAGFSDWRLPGNHELRSLVNAGRRNPSIDTTAFPSTPADLFWSATSKVGDVAFAWTVGFDEGMALMSGKSGNARFRCVRGSSGSVALPSGRFVLAGSAGDETVADAISGLIWTKNYSTGRNWQQALAYCEALEMAGANDWRLPNREELASLIDYSTSGPATRFPDCPSVAFWTSTSSLYLQSNAIYVDFSSADLYYHPKSSSHLARCVRGGP